VTTALVTGATGTFGQALLQAAPGWTIRAYSRDEHKQAELAEFYPEVRWLLGDVRDRARLKRAMEGADVVVHAAALKHVTAGEYNPDEFVKTNVLGTLNVAQACLDAGVEKAVFLSSDKAVHPVNLYGATKLCGEKVWLSAGNLHGQQTRFSVVRYGNVKGSRGSVLTKEAPVLRDARATRFWMDPEHAVLLVLLAVEQMQGGEVFVPKLEASLVTDMQNSWVEGPGGLLPGEKLHESLVSDEEVGRTYDFGSHYCILPRDHPLALISVPVPDDFTYTSG
jgi:UDP-N-acetylglucosamine 4,6-dehydratase